MTWYELCIVVRMQHEWTRMDTNFQNLFRFLSVALLHITLTITWTGDGRSLVLLEWWSGGANDAALLVKVDLVPDP
jgi:hypothetical protein